MLSAGWQTISWEVPASTWRPGANEVALRTSSLATADAGDPISGGGRSISGDGAWSGSCHESVGPRPIGRRG